MPPLPYYPVSHTSELLFWPLRALFAFGWRDFCVAFVLGAIAGLFVYALGDFPAHLIDTVAEVFRDQASDTGNRPLIWDLFIFADQWDLNLPLIAGLSVVLLVLAIRLALLVWYLLFLVMLASAVLAIGLVGWTSYWLYWRLRHRSCDGVDESPESGPPSFFAPLRALLRLEPSPSPPAGPASGRGLFPPGSIPRGGAWSHSRLA